LTGRKASNLSRTLKTMSRYGLVRLVHKAGPRQARRRRPRGAGARSADGPVARRMNGRPFCRCPRISRLRRFAAAVQENVRPALDA
jgi:hypothetical protein